MSVKLLAEQHLEFLIFKGGLTSLYESTLVKMPHYWKSHGLSRLIFILLFKSKETGSLSFLPVSIDTMYVTFCLNNH